MSAGSVTGYTIQDTLPRDKGGQKMWALVREEASAAGYLLPKGIAGSIAGASLQFGHLAIGTHTQGSKVEARHPGIQLGGIYLDSTLASKTSANNGEFRLAGISRWGEIFTTQASATTSNITAGSRNTVLATSGLLKAINYVSLNKTDTASVIITDNGLFKHAIVANGASFSKYQSFPGGIHIGTSLTIDIHFGGGTASVTVHLGE